jgi:hemerythrin
VRIIIPFVKTELIMIRTHEPASFVVKIGLPTFDEQCEKLVRILELLDLSPLHTVASDVFLSRFLVFRDAIEEFFMSEEKLLNSCAVPDDIRFLHISDHQRIREMLHNVYMNALGKKNQTAIEVYKAISFKINQHVANFSFDLGQYLPQSKH